MGHTLAYYAICRIGRGPFPSERSFKITKADGSEHFSLSPVDYCHHADGSALKGGEPSGDEVLQGMIDVEFLSNGGETARINLPDGKTITVGTDQLVCLRAKDTEYVSLRSGHPVGC